MHKLKIMFLAVFLVALAVPAAAGAAKGNDNGNGNSRAQQNEASELPACVIDHGGEFVEVTAVDLPLGETISFRYTNADGSTEAWALGISTYDTKTVMLAHYDGERTFEFSATSNGRGKLKPVSTCQG
jgi:hypothetical protein